MAYESKSFTQYNGYDLSSMKCFTSSSKRFINAHKDDIEIYLRESGMINVFYGESGGEFKWNALHKEYELDYGNLYKSNIMKKIVNELLKAR